MYLKGLEALPVLEQVLGEGTEIEYRLNSHSDLGLIIHAFIIHQRREFQTRHTTNLRT